MTKLTDQFLKHFPGFKTFEYSGDSFKYHEDDYKRAAVDLLHDLLDSWVVNPSSLSSEQLKEKVEAVFRKPLPNISPSFTQNLTGWRDNQYIFDDLLATEKNRDLFFDHLYPLLSRASTNENIDRELVNFLGWLDGAGAAPAITKVFPSLVLFYWNPNRFIFIKPTIFDKFLQEIGQKPLGWGKKLTVSEYNRILKIVLDFGNTISELRPRDMVDLQSFYYVLMAYGDKDLPDYTVEDFPSELTDLAEAKDSFRELDETEREAVISSRLGQGLFRANLIKYWEGCAVTGCKNFDVLIASHIKPWRMCSNKERLDTHNGLLLIPNLDKLFDKELITFEDNGKILISSRLSGDDLLRLKITPDMRLRRKLSKEQLSYIRFHREELFKS